MHCINNYSKEFTSVSERVIGRKARGFQMEEIGCKCQTFFISPLSSRRKQTTSVRFFSLKILCCPENTWLHPNLTFLKPWTNHCVFLMEIFFLSYVNEPMYFLWDLPFFKMVSPKTKLWLIIAQQTSVQINCFMAGGWHTLCHPISKMHVVGKGPGETPSALRWLSYLINSFLADIKHPVRLAGGHSLSPFWCLGQKLSLSLFIL